MPEKQRMTTRLKELFERPEIFVLAGGMNAMGARMAEVAGYEAFYMSGGNTSAQVMGLTEGGTSMRDMVDNARRIVNTVDIPVFCDMDTGYGDAIQVYETIKEYVRAGIAGAHLEDQTYPPKTGPRRRCVLHRGDGGQAESGHGRQDGVRPRLRHRGPVRFRRRSRLHLRGSNGTLPGL